MNWGNVGSGLGRHQRECFPAPSDMGRHSPASQNQSSPIFMNLHFDFGGFRPVNSKSARSGSGNADTAAAKLIARSHSVENGGVSFIGILRYTAI